MASRLELQTELETLLGSKEVYFQPPESKKLGYPCFVYNRSNINTKQANNRNYMFVNCYELTYIYRDPDDTIPRQVLEQFQYCSFSRHFVTDNLYHDTFTLYY